MAESTMNRKSNIIAGPVQQEYAEHISRIAKVYGISEVGFSSVGCTIGSIGVYIVCTTEYVKSLFLEEISEWFSKETAWAC